MPQKNQYNSGMANALGSATVSFGLVSIPTKIYSTTQASNEVSFNLLHKKCNSRLKQQYVCPVDNEIVTRDEMIKGYEYEKGHFVTFTAEELKAFEEKPTQSIDIVEFISQDLVDPLFYDKAYFLGADKGGDKAYLLLSEAMRRTKRVALARYAARGKQYLVMLRAVSDGLVMQQLHYADELRSSKEVPKPEGSVKEHEMKLALQLIEQITSKSFKPEKYEDDVKQRRLDAIQEKMAGKDIVAPPLEAPRAQIIDLMDALKASLGAPSDPEQARKPPQRAPAKKKTAAKTKKAQ